MSSPLLKRVHRLAAPTFTTSIIRPPYTSVFHITNMPPRKRAHAKADLGDFIDDGDNADSHTKRTKTKASVATPNAEKQVDADGNPFWELGGRLRRATLSTFNGSILVNIREHYEKDGKVLPGKKGISLSVEQFNAMMNILPQLHATLAEKSGSKIITPLLGNERQSAEDGKSIIDREVKEEEEEEEEAKEEETKSVQPGKKEGKKKKAKSKEFVDEEDME